MFSLGFWSLEWYSCHVRVFFSVEVMYKILLERFPLSFLTYRGGFLDICLLVRIRKDRLSNRTGQGVPKTLQDVSVLYFSKLETYTSPGSSSIIIIKTKPEKGSRRNDYSRIPMTFIQYNFQILLKKKTKMFFILL